jgi:hypothetical protein
LTVTASVAVVGAVVAAVLIRRTVPKPGSQAAAPADVPVAAVEIAA